MVTGFEVVRAAELLSGLKTPGILREWAFDSGSMLFSKSTVEGGAVSGWHHHGERDLYGYVVSGRLTLEFKGEGSGETVLSPGDFFHISPGVVHRDVNPDSSESVVIVNVLSGSGPTLVNVGHDQPT